MHQLLVILSFVCLFLSFASSRVFSLRFSMKEELLKTEWFWCCIVGGGSGWSVQISVWYFEPYTRTRRVLHCLHWNPTVTWSGFPSLVFAADFRQMTPSSLFPGTSRSIPAVSLGTNKCSVQLSWLERMCREMPECENPLSRFISVICRP